MYVKDSIEQVEFIKSWQKFTHWAANKAAIAIPNSRIDHDDLYQVGMLALLEAEDKFDDSKGLDKDKWIMFKIRTAMIDHIRVALGRAEKYRSHHECEYIDEFHAPSVEDVIEDPFIHQQLQDSMSRLLPMEQSVIDLYYFHDMTLAAIGEVYGFTESRASQLATLGLKKMRHSPGARSLR